MTQADGTLVVSGEIAVIAFERRLRHSVEVVWAALTEPQELTAWLGQGVLEPREGGQISIRTGPVDQPARQGLISGRVLAWDPPRVLEHEWSQPGLDVSVVRYELEAEGSGTVLRLTHRRSVRPGATGGRAGWHAYLDRLGAHLDGQPVPAWAERRARVQDAYGEAPLPGS
jgi:uncharacterized protein YndB with AHSA1/START domain